MSGREQVSHTKTWGNSPLSLGQRPFPQLFFWPYTSADTENSALTKALGAAVSPARSANLLVFDRDKPRASHCFGQLLMERWQLQGYVMLEKIADPPAAHCPTEYQGLSTERQSRRLSEPRRYRAAGRRREIGSRGSGCPGHVHRQAGHYYGPPRVATSPGPTARAAGCP